MLPKNEHEKIILYVYFECVQRKAAGRDSLHKKCCPKLSHKSLRQKRQKNYSGKFPTRLGAEDRSR